MPIKHGIGYGEYTPEKLQCFESFLSMHIRWTKAVLQRHPYWVFTYNYIDATAGCGYCPESNMPGSPLVFLAIAHRLGMPYHADFIEVEPGNHFLLAGAIPHDAHQYVSTHHGDYCDVLPRLIERLDKNAFGLIFIDHSGAVTELMDRIEILERLSIKHPKIEILIYVPAANVKRVLYHRNIRLEDCLQGIRKRHWLVRKPMGKHQWTFLMGSNTPPPEYPSIGFYRLDSQEGQQIFGILNYTNQELEECQQLNLPSIERMPNISRIQSIAVSEQMPLNGLAEYVNDAKRGQ